MATIKNHPSAIRGICSCVPHKLFNNLTDTSAFSEQEVRKVVKMAGVRTRYVSPERICSSDLCEAAAHRLLNSLEWDPQSVDALIMVTQSPDYFLPSTACILQDKLNLPDTCAAFDVGLGCSGYPYGLWLASMMLNTSGIKRVLLLHGETPSRFAEESDRSVALLFGDAGSATAIEGIENEGINPWYFCLHTDGSGYKDLILEGGGFRNRNPDDLSKMYVKMNGANIFNFTIKRVPKLVEDTLAAAEITPDDVDYFIFHQSNRFIMKHLSQKLQLPQEKLPFTIEQFGSTGGPSIPLTITQGELKRSEESGLSLMLISYGVGLSWASALIDLDPEAVLDHIQLHLPT